MLFYFHVIRLFYLKIKILLILRINHPKGYKYPKLDFYIPYLARKPTKVSKTTKSKSTHLPSISFGGLLLLSSGENISPPKFIIAVKFVT